MPAFAWTTDAKEAEKEQGFLKELLKVTTTLPPSLEFNQGLAIGTAYDENAKKAFAFGVRFDASGYYRAGVNEFGYRADVDFPYTPGLLAYRVGPAVCRLLDKIVDEIDVILIDGQGIAHQRGFGLASHIGVLYDKPAVGVTRNNLFGSVNEPPTGRFNKHAIIHPRTARLIGYAVSLGEKCKPCYVSPGHKMSVEDAAQFVCNVAGDTCFPRPLNRAHARANAAAKTYGKRFRALR